MKKLKSIEGMMTSFTKRHGLTEKLLAHDVVSRAQALLFAKVSGSPLASDMLALSFSRDVITFAFRNTAARYAGQEVAQAIARELEQEFPHLTLRTQCVLEPNAWERILS